MVLKLCKEEYYTNKTSHDTLEARQTKLNSRNNEIRLWFPEIDTGTQIEEAIEHESTFLGNYNISRYYRPVE